MLNSTLPTPRPIFTTHGHRPPRTKQYYIKINYELSKRFRLNFLIPEMKSVEMLVAVFIFIIKQMCPAIRKFRLLDIHYIYYFTI